jgi:hypothetical protein
MRSRFPGSKIAAVGLAIFALSPLFLRGQTYETFEARQTTILDQARWRIGPFRLLPAFQLRDVGYDDNVYYLSRTEQPIGDFTATISPSLTAFLLYRHWIILSVHENPEYVFFFKQKSERSWNNNFSPEIRLRLPGNFSLTGNYRFQKTRRRASSEFDVRANEKDRSYGGQLFYETPRRTAIGLSAQVLRISYEDVLFPNQQQYLSVALNRKETSGNFEIYYRIFSESFFFIRGGATQYKFDSLESQWRNSSSRQVYAGIRFPLLGRIRGTLALGYKGFTPTDRGKKPFSGLVGNSRLDYRAGRFDFRVLYGRDCQFSYFLDYIYFLENVLGSGMSYYLTPFLRLDYDFTYGQNGYPEPVLVRQPGGEWTSLLRRDRSNTHTVGAVVRVVRNTGIGIQYNYWQRTSNYSVENRSRWFLGGYITYDF